MNSRSDEFRDDDDAILTEDAFRSSHAPAHSHRSSMSIPISTTNMCRARAPTLRQAFHRRPTHCSAASMADCRPATRRGCSKRRKAAPASNSRKRASDMEKAAGTPCRLFFAPLRPAGYCWAGAAGCSGAAPPLGTGASRRCSSAWSSVVCWAICSRSWARLCCSFIRFWRASWMRWSIC